MRIHTRRIYDGPARSDGWRVLVDRLWPRGVSRDDAELDEWAGDHAPSDELRKWFGHDPGKWWDGFRKRYREELAGKGDRICELADNCPKETITLLYAAKDQEHNNAVVLREYIRSEVLD